MKDRTGKGNSVCFFTHLFLFPVLILKAVRYTEVDVSLAVRQLGTTYLLLFPLPLP